MKQYMLVCSEENMGKLIELSNGLITFVEVLSIGLSPTDKYQIIISPNKSHEQVAENV